jgi:hypothetical protein
VLRFVGAWACREGTPEDDEDEDEDERACVLRDDRDCMEMGVFERDRNATATRSTRRQEDGEDVQERAQ